MPNIRLAVSQASLQEITATWRDVHLATGEGRQSEEKHSYKKAMNEMKNIHFVATKTLSQSSLKSRGFCAALLIFLQRCPRDGAEKMRSGSKVYVLPQLGGNVSRGFSWSFILSVLPLDGLKVSVFLAVGGELNMKGISKWAGRLQTSALGQFPIIVIYYPGQIVMPDTDSSIAIRCASATGRQVITSTMGGGYVSVC